MKFISFNFEIRLFSRFFFFCYDQSRYKWRVINLNFFWKRSEGEKYNWICCFRSPWNSFLAALTEVTMLATCPSTVANNSRPNSSWAITNKYSPLLLGLEKNEMGEHKLHVLPYVSNYWWIYSQRDNFLISRITCNVNWTKFILKCIKNNCFNIT